eukprot:GHVR01098058.1.p1 GENE.GHVR01098058.1~~GHVR01098058.1.p1  ORF type:complete len:336 (+),score=10.01 GHVR01098058.1:212-1219(+)
MDYFIDPRQVFTYMNNNFKLHKSTNGWWNLKCPFCNEYTNREKLAIHLEHQFMKCWVCEFRGSVLDFISEYEGITVRNAVDKLRSQKKSRVKFDLLEDKKVTFSDVGLPAGYTPILEGDGVLGIRARQYLVNRGLNLKSMDRLGVGYGVRVELKAGEEDWFGYIIVPFKERGVLKYYIGRDFIGQFLRYKNPPKEMFNVGKGDLIFNRDAVDIQETVFITEGWTDACTMGLQGTSTQGWRMSKRQKAIYLNGNANRYVFLPDAGHENGTTFYEKAVEVAMDFIDHKECYVVDLNLLSEYGKDANKIGRSKILEQYANTAPLTFELGTEILMDYVL